MNLVIDVGNSRTKAGLFQGDQLEWAMPAQAMEAHEWVALFQRPDIDKAILSSSGKVSSSLQDLLSSARFPFIELQPDLSIPFEMDYDTPETLGLDRIANAAAASFTFPDSTSLVIDAGTCITYDLVENGKIYRGGIISPGLKMRRQAMHEFTANLPLVEGLPNDLLGKSTKDCMLSGSFLGMISEIQGIINSFRERFTSVQVLITGGDHMALQKHLESGIFARPYLQLEGLNGLLNYQ